MRYHIFATDYDGTLARNGKVDRKTIEKLKLLKTTGRKIVLVTGREMRWLVTDFPEYFIFDHIVAENGATLYDSSTSMEVSLASPPDSRFVQALKDAGVAPISVGKVIVATWVPHETTVLKIIKEQGLELQVIFNKGAVMILPPGVNKATGLKCLLNQIHFSEHNLVVVGDAENDNAMLRIAECGIAVANALPSLKEIADLTTHADEGDGVNEIIDRLISDDLSEVGPSLTRHFLQLGHKHDGSAFSIDPFRSGILLSGVSGGGKTTVALSLIEILIKSSYQFCLIDPEGDYLNLEGAQVVGNEHSLPTLEELFALMKDPSQNLVICILSIPLMERPAYFAGFLMAYSSFKYETGHPHWLLLDEAHHLCPSATGPGSYPLPEDFQNFLLITTSVDRLNRNVLCRTGTVLIVGHNWTYPVEQYMSTCNTVMPPIPSSIEGHMLVWNPHEKEKPYPIRYILPMKFLTRHKRKYAQGDMGSNSFVFTGKGNKMHLVAPNVLLFRHIAEGIDDETWLFHWQRNDYSNWFRDKVHDEALASIGKYPDQNADGKDARRKILAYIKKNYTP